MRPTNHTCQCSGCLQKISLTSWPLSPQLLSSYQKNISTHIFLSDLSLEPYPILLDQARALGALAVAPSLPPWREHLDDSSGVLLKPSGQNAAGGGGLGRKGGTAAGGDVSGGGEQLLLEDVCKGVQAVMNLSPQVRMEKRVPMRQGAVQYICLCGKSLHH